MNTLFFNFIELKEQEIDFLIYRRKVIENNKEDKELYRYKLPIDNSLDSEYLLYDISLAQKDGFEEFNYKFSQNALFSKRILFEKYKPILQSHYKDNFYLSNNDFNNELIIVYDTKDLGKQVIILIPYFYKAQNKYGFIVEFKFISNPGVEFNIKVQQYSLSIDNHGKSNRNFNKDKFSIINNVLNSLPDLVLYNYTIQLCKELIEVPYKLLHTKKYLFKNNKESSSQFNGVKDIGVYNEVQNKDLLYVFTFKEEYKNFANNVYAFLSGKANNSAFLGLERMFNIPLNTNSIAKVPFISIEETIKSILEIKNHNLQKNVIVIYLEKNNHDVTEQENYYKLKYNLLKNNIPLQVLTHEKLSSNDVLKWSVSSIGLQIFSKLGGIPWLVKPETEKCLILGIGKAHKYDEAENIINKYFAYSVCVDSSGQYKKLSVLAETENNEDYLNNLRSNLILLLEDSEFKDYKKCAIHLPYKIKHKEIEKIKEAIESVSKEIQIFILKVNQDSNYFGYSEHLTKIPYESSYIELGKNEYLIWFEGLNYGKEHNSKRTSNPIHVEFLLNNPNNPKEDLIYLQDLLNLSGANWRGFNAKNLPISLYYAKIIADYTKEFEQFDDFNRNIFINNKPWFL